MSKTRRQFFEKTNKIAKLLAKLRKKKEDSNKIKKERRNSKTDATNKKIKRQLEKMAEEQDGVITFSSTNSLKEQQNGEQSLQNNF